jgi:hypothetical protein
MSRGEGGEKRGKIKRAGSSERPRDKPHSPQKLHLKNKRTTQKRQGENENQRKEKEDRGRKHEKEK